MKKRSQGCMEYVVVAVLICAAVAVAIWLFWSQIMAMFGTVGSATCGTHEAAGECISAQRADSEACSAAKESANRFIDKDWTDASDVRASELDDRVNPESEGRHSVR